MYPCVTLEDTETNDDLLCSWITSWMHLFRKRLSFVDSLDELNFTGSKTLRSTILKTRHLALDVQVIFSARLFDAGLKFYQQVNAICILYYWPGKMNTI